MKNIISGSLLASTIIMATPLTTLASEEEDTLDPVVVTASKQPQLVSETLASAFVIDREQIEQSGAADVSDLLRFHAGLDVSRSGGPGQQTSLFMRGTNSGHTRVMINGVHINSASTGGAPWERIRPQNIERIEVVRGPRSATHGADAIGGVINIITRQPEQPRFLEVEAGGGSFNTRETSVTGGLRNDNHRLSASVSHFETDGFPVRGDESEDRGADNTTLTLGGETRLGGATLDGDYWLTRGNTEFSQFGASRDQDFHNEALRLGISGAPSDTWFTRLDLNQAEDELEQNQSSDFVHTRRTTADWQNDFIINPENSLTLGFFGEHEDVESAAYDEQTTLWAGYIEGSFGAGPHRGLTALRHTSHPDFGDENTWNLEYGYHLSQATRISVGGGTAFKAPTGSDRFGPSGNPDLDPETSRNIELGLRHRLSSAQLLTASAFHNEIDDLIVLVEDPPGSFQYEARNIDEARIRGLELAWQLETDNWQSRIEGVLQDPEDRGTGQQLDRRSKRSLTAHLSRRFGMHRVGVDMLARSESRDFGGKLPGFAIFNANARYHLTPRWSLNVRLENLLDKDYETAHAATDVPYSNPGRSLFATLRFNTR